MSINDFCKKLVKGENIKRYQLVYNGKWFLYDLEKLYRPSFPQLFENEKLIVSEVTGENGLVATYDNEKYYTDHSLNCCILKYHLKEIDPNTLRKHKLYINEEEVELSKSYNLKYVLALINSHLTNFYFKTILGYKLNVYPESIEQLPMRPIDFSKSSEKSIHDDLVSLVDAMLSLNKQISEIRADFQHYLNLRPHSMVTLRSFMDALPVGDKEVLKDHFGKPVSTIEAEKFDAFDMLEEGEWLVFVVGYNYTGGKGRSLSSSNVRALRLRIPDISMRKFIYFSLKGSAPGKLGSGNILEQLQKLKIPRLVINGEGNMNAIQELMSPFLIEVAKREALEREIKEIDDTIDKKVCALYELTDEEIKIIEEK